MALGLLKTAIRATRLEMCSAISESKDVSRAIGLWGNVKDQSLLMGRGVTKWKNCEFEMHPNPIRGDVKIQLLATVNHCKSLQTLSFTKTIANFKNSIFPYYRFNVKMQAYVIIKQNLLTQYWLRMVDFKLLVHPYQQPFANTCKLSPHILTSPLRQGQTCHTPLKRDGNLWCPFSRAKTFLILRFLVILVSTYKLAIGQFALSTSVYRISIFIFFKTTY